MLLRSIPQASCSIVLGYNWLTHYNLLIDWVLSSIIFPKIPYPNRRLFVQPFQKNWKQPTQPNPMTMTMTPTSMTPNHTILKVMNPIPRHLRTLRTMLRLISPWSMQYLTNVPVSCPDPNPSVSPCQMAKLRHARLWLRQKNRLTSPASPKNIMTLPMFSAKLKPTNYHLTDLTI